MSEKYNTVHRITCTVRHNRNSVITKLLPELGIQSVFIENGRSVRRRRYARLLSRYGYTERLDDSPVDLYQFSIAPDDSENIIKTLSDKLYMKRPGHGTIYAQKCRTFKDITRTDLNITDSPNQSPYGLLQNLSVITCIMSMSGSGEELAKLALELGTGVPIVSLGFGTGLRERLGLLRITVPAEKEVVRLVVPAQDAESIMRLLIEKGHLDRPGKGFIYCSPVLYGLLDTTISVGPQQHIATIEQVVAAIDALEKNTSWRRRFPELETKSHLQTKHDEITLICAEEAAGIYIEAATQAGANISTNTHLQCVTFDETDGGARECYTFVVHNSITKQVMETLRQTCENSETGLDCLEVQPVNFAFAYRSNQK